MTSSEQIKTPSVYAHTHWDREWYLSFRAYQVRLVDVVDAILDRLAHNVFPCFLLDGQTVLLEDYLAIRPEKKTELQGHIQSGRLRIGPWYVMPDEFLVSGESLLRNLKLGIAQSRAFAQKGPFCGYLPDTFGHSADMPTLLSLCGIENALLWRGVSPETSEFFWKSPAGKTVQGYHLADGYFQMMLHQTDDDPDFGPDGKAGALKALAEKLSARTNQSTYLMPIGGDHLGPVDASGVVLLKQQFSGFQWTTPDQFLSKLTPKPGQPEICGELSDYQDAFLLPGVYSSRMYLKQANRKLEHALVYRWEPLEALAYAITGKAPYQNILQSAWNLLLLNHPHDSICGCSIDAVHRENETRFQEVADLYRATTERLKRQIQQKLACDKSYDNQWLVINTANASFTGVVSVTSVNKEDLAQYGATQTLLRDDYRHDMMQVPLSHKTVERHQGWIWVQQAKAFSVTALGPKIAPALPDREKQTSLQLNGQSKKNEPLAQIIQQAVFENEYYQVVCSIQDGIQVTDKLTGQSYDHFHQFKDTPQQGDSYNAAPVPGESSTIGVLTQISAWQSGPLVSGVYLYYQIGSLQAVTRVWVEAGSSLLQFETELNNTQPDHCLQVTFETHSPVQSVFCESHCSIIERRYDPDYRIEAHMPAGVWKELKTNTGPIQRFVVANQQAFFTQGLCEYEIYQKTLALTLLRGFDRISKRDTGVRGASAGPPFETPEGQCLRPFVFQYAWCRLPEKSKGFEAALANLPMLAERFYQTVEAIPPEVQCSKITQFQTDSPTNLASENQAPLFQLYQWDNPYVHRMASYIKLVSENNKVKPLLILRLVNYSPLDQSLQLESGSYKLPETTQLLNGLDEPQGQRVRLNKPIVLKAFEVKTLAIELPVFADSD